MAIGVLFDFHGGTREQYDDITQDLNNGQPLTNLSEWPVPGILCHVSGPMSDGWRVFDVWESEEAFQQFGQYLMPLMQKHGMPPAEPQVFPIHVIITQ